MLLPTVIIYIYMMLKHLYVVAILLIILYTLNEASSSYSS